jgi:hypothetical protein
MIAGWNSLNENSEAGFLSLLGGSWRAIFLPEIIFDKS